MLDKKIEEIDKIGKKLAKYLKKLDISTVKDLLYYFPYRYEDWSKIKKISDIAIGEPVTIKGKIEQLQNRRSYYRKKIITEAILSDNTGKIKIIWFHQPYLIKVLKKGDTIYVSGTVEIGEGGWQLTHPVYEKASGRRTHTGRIVPIYPLTQKITQKQIRYLTSKVIKYISYIQEWLPYEVRKKADLIPLKTALKYIHFPSKWEEIQKAEERLKFDELFLINLHSRQIKQHTKHLKAYQVKFLKEETKKFISQLPFDLTSDQKKAAWDILKDIQKSHPSGRLLNGDVGSGKTITCSLAILNTLLNGLQAAYMAPTEILARQQYQNFSKLFAKYSFKIALITSKDVKINNKNIKKQELKKLIKKGEVNLVIGTHALIQESVKWKNLALAIVDEQHRFGVKQRAAFTTQEGEYMPHFLSMTATPIPRTLALVLYNDLNISIIRQMPKGRKPIKTYFVPQEKKGECLRFIHKKIKEGRQVYVICPLIDPSDKLGKRAAVEEYEKLKNIFPDVNIGLLHGKMKSEEKEKIMQEFAQGKIDILVSTPVIEVGIDVPNATCMIIESAERFGLAQLHQLRGRVGRGKYQSYCFLFSDSTSQESIRRLKTLVSCSDGFKLAEKDLEYRGPGQIYGVKQHGFNDMLTIAKLTDYHIIKKVQQISEYLFQTSPDLSQYPTIKQKLEAFSKQVHLE